MKISTAGILVLAACGVMSAHPMGNFSVNRYALVMPGAHDIDVLYVLDLAELPTFQMLREWGLTKDSPPAELEGRARRQAAEWVKNLTFTEAGVRVRPATGRMDFALQDGAGGLPVVRINLHLKVPGRTGAFSYEDHNFPERAGWKEVVIEAKPGASISGMMPGGTDRSRALTAYPQDANVAAPQDVSAKFLYMVSAPVVKSPVATALPTIATGPTPPESNSLGTVKRDDFLSRTLKGSKGALPIGLTLLCVAAAFGVGALHAVEPGHGKTMVAAYLVGSRGTYKQAIFLGGMVTFTHTISVFALGLVTLFLAEYLLPDNLIRVMGVISGVSIIAVGGSLLYRRARKLIRPAKHAHSHSHEHPHAHTHTHDGHTHSHVPDADVSLGNLIALGISGGLVPCPAALVLLLSSISIGRPGLGLILLLSFSLGLALVLMAIGMVALVVKNSVPKSSKPSHAAAWARYAPVFSAAFIFAIGIYMTGVAMGAFPVVRVIG